jgi:predicted cupin superfamily sugar epimerase
MLPSPRTLLGLLSLVVPTIHSAALITTTATSSSPSAHIPINHRSAAEVIAQLNLTANPEKGYYVETFRDTNLLAASNRSSSTAIFYLLEGSAGSSIWHRVTDAVEVWHYYAGAPLVLSLSWDDGQPVEEKTLGPDVFQRGQSPQVVIQKGQWQSAESLGEWTLVGTTVAPGFVPTGVELAAEAWTPNGA